MQIVKSNEQAAKFREEGSELLTQAKFFDALVALNKCLCLAEPGSLEISLAFEKRSEVFFQVDQHEKCLSNILAAKEHGYPNDKIEQLNEREAKCKQMIDEKCESSIDELRNFIKMSQPQSLFFLTAWSCASLKNMADISLRRESYNLTKSSRSRSRTSTL